jgi:hypothetical protein
MSANKKNILWIFLFIWLIINLIQAIFMGLMSDEAYYFFYSRDLAWGYYDHPPLTAILIRLGSLVFSNELGVRFMFILLSAGTILVLHKLSDVKNEFLFGALFFSFMIFQITGFLAIPDSLLVFFTALFFLVYNKYCEKNNMQQALLLGLVMAGMLYSKYLGIVIIFLTVISNIQLLWRRSFWAAVIVTAVLFIPHLYWQYQHDFPSLYYHLVERSHDEVFRWSNFGDYITGQIMLINPFLFIPVIYFMIKYKAHNKYERSLLFASFGSLLLPFLLMIRGRVEANWTIAGLIPVFLISYKVFESLPKFYRYLYYSSGLTVVMIIMFRILLIHDFLPERYKVMFQSFSDQWKAYSQEINQLAKGRPVVYIGSYQGPSQYMFYTEKEAFSFNNYLYRSNQFDLEGIEKTLQGRDVLIITPRLNMDTADMRAYNIQLSDSLLTPSGAYHYYFNDSNYRTYNFIRADILLKDHEFKAGSELNIPVRLLNQSDLPLAFNEAEPEKVYLTYILLQHGKKVIYKKFEDISNLEIDEEYTTSFNMSIPARPGTYFLRVSIKSGWLPPGINSRLFKIRVR